MQHLQKTGGLRPFDVLVYTLQFPFWNSSPSPSPLQSQRTSPCYHRRCCLRFSQESEPGMTARILDGTKIRDQIFAELKDEVRLLTAAGVRPGLAAVLVGENPASQLYVKSKIAACEERSEEHTSELQSRFDLVCRLLLEKKKKEKKKNQRNTLSSKQMNMQTR